MSAEWSIFQEKKGADDQQSFGGAEVEIPIERNAIALPPQPDAAIIPEREDEKKEDDRCESFDFNKNNVFF